MDEARQDCPQMCIKNCGFFGTAENMNMCSKCYKEMELEQAKKAAKALENMASSSGSNCSIEEIHSDDGCLRTTAECSPATHETSREEKGSSVPSRCSYCKKKVRLCGFTCRCGSVFCSQHRYSEKHDCQFDYRTAAREAIGEANPVVKTPKLDKI